MHRARQGGADQDPEKPGQVAELRRQHRADQGAGAGDRREMMSEQYPAVGRVIITAVFKTVRRSHAAGIQAQYLGGYERAVETVSDDVNAGGGNDYP